MLQTNVQEKRAITACFTGHRDLPRGSEQAITNATKRTIKLLYEQGYRHFITGGARGFDTLAALAVLAAKDYYGDVTLELCLPCKNQSSGWTAEEKALYESIRERADSYAVLADHYYNGCMQARNRALVDKSSYCIAYLTSKSSKGGTVYTVNYANKKGVPVVNIANIL